MPPVWNGLTQDQLTNLIDAPFNEPDYTQQYIRDDAQVFESGEPLDIPEEPVTRFDGVVRQFHTVKSAIRDDAGAVIYTVGVSHDITEQQLAERQLRTNELLIHGLLDSTPAAMYVLDLDGRYLFANRLAAQMVGVEPNALLGRSVTEWLPLEARSQWQTLTDQVILSGGVLANEDTVQLPDGKRTLVSSIVPLCDETGAVIAIGGVSSDVTERKHAEEEARRSAAYAESILSAIPGLIFIVNDDGDYLDYRTDNEHLLLAPAGSFIGKNIREVLPHMAEAFLAIIRAARTTGKVQSWAFPAETPDGTRYFEGQAAPVGDDRLLLLMREVTEQKQMEFERERLQEDVIRMQAAALAELSTPLIPINDRVVVMPLIGAVDSRRVQQVIDTLLDGVSRTRVTTAILDITGVPVVDTQVANGLVRAAQAVRLLGARVVLTGIRPEVAQTLVGLGADLNGVVTRSTLQSGIAYATGHS